MEMTDVTEIAYRTWYSQTTGMVMLDLNDAVSDIQPMNVDGIDLLPKGEYHTTLVSVRRDLSEFKKESRFVNKLSDFLVQNPVELSIIGLERYLCQKDNEATVIAPVHLFGEQALKSFVQKYIPHYSPFYHVTLLKNEQTEHGIRISSREDLDARCTLL